MASRMISHRRLSRLVPEKRFLGRERTSLISRWVTNWGMTLGVLYVMASYLLTFFGIRLYNPLLLGVGRADVSPPPLVASVDDMTITPSSFHASTIDGVVVSTPDLVPLAGSPGKQEIQSTYTPLPTSTPYPVQVRPYSLGYVYAVGYSYYWPPYGPPNCSDENWKAEWNICEDTTASGEKWTLWIGRGIAVPIQWRDDIPLMSVVRITGNIAVQGDYTVIDYCGRCIKDDGFVYVDFLSNRQVLPWTVPLLMEVIYVAE